jgi:hypothetical protein
VRLGPVIAKIMKKVMATILVVPLPIACSRNGLMKKTSQHALSPEAKEVVEMINDVASGIMFEQYQNLPTGAKMRVAEVTRNTQRMLDEDATS